MKKRFRLRTFAGLTTLAALAATVTMILAGGAGAVVAGAGFTTNDPNHDGPGTCLNGNSDPDPSVNCNLYGSKSYVWTNGGPSNGKNTLSAGTYFFAVLAPSGQQDPNDGAPANLSDVTPTSGTGAGDLYTAREFIVDSTGKITSYLGGGHLTDDHYVAGGNGLFINLMPYDDTTNPGGVYIMAVCQVSGDTTETEPEILSAPVTPSACKYDAFKAPLSSCTVDCEPTPFGAISGLKYYDADLSGTFTTGDIPIPGWNIDYWDGTSDTLVTDGNGEFSVTLTGDTYNFAEEHPTNTTGAPFNLPLWFQTGNTSLQTTVSGGDSAALNSFVYTITHTDEGSTSGVDFGNVCLGGGGGLTLGFWSNKNGQALEIASDFTLLTSLNLRNANGSPRDFTDTLAKNKTALSQWLLAATATNMANMLSAQLAAMELNVAHGKVSGSSNVFVGGTINGFMTVNDLMAEANRVLANPIVGTTFAGQNGSVTLAASALRTYQEALKSALDAGNNNVNFVQQPTNGQLPACASTAITGWTTAFPTS